MEDGVFGLDSQALEQKMEHMTGDMDAPGYDWSSREVLFDLFESRNIVHN